MFPVYVNIDDKSYSHMNSLLPAGCLWSVALFLRRSQMLEEKSRIFYRYAISRSYVLHFFTNMKLESCCYDSNIHNPRAFFCYVNMAIYNPRWNDQRDSEIYFKQSVISITYVYNNLFSYSYILSA